MKKIILTLMVAVMGILGLEARDVVTRDANVLPAAARQTLTKNFPKQKINHIKVDTDMFGKKDFDVILDNGVEVDFNKAGEWKEVDTGYRGVPAGFILPAIRQYLKANHKGVMVVKIDKDARGYELKLDNGLDLEFDRSGRFLRVDD